MSQGLGNGNVPFYETAYNTAVSLAKDIRAFQTLLREAKEQGKEFKWPRDDGEWDQYNSHLRHRRHQSGSVPNRDASEEEEKLTAQISKLSDESQHNYRFRQYLENPDTPEDEIIKVRANERELIGLRWKLFDDQNTTRPES